MMVVSSIKTPRIKWLRVPYRTIVADPPWPVKDSGARTAPLSGHRAGNWEKGAGTEGKPSVVPYVRLSIPQIGALPVESLAERDAHLYLWVVNEFLPDAYQIARWWGFKPVELLTWCKPPMGLGFGGAYCNTTEFVLFCRRGSLRAKRRWQSSWFNWSRPYIGTGGPTHSAKPEHFLDVVEQVSPGPYVELFARRHRLGWDVWGNESANTAELAV